MAIMVDEAAKKDFEERNARPGEVTGASYLKDVLNGRAKYDAKKIEIAKTLVRFELPTLNKVDAVQRNVEMSHEDWIRAIEGDE